MNSLVLQFMTVVCAGFAIGVTPPAGIAPNDPRPMTDRPPKLTFEEHVDYHAWYNDYVSRNKTENAYPYYLAILEKIENGALPEPSEAVDKQINDLKYGPVWKPEDYPELAAYLDSCSEVLAEFERATQIAHCWHPLAENERLLTHTLDNKACDKRIRSLYRLVLVRSWKEADNQSDSFLRSWRTLLRYANHMAQCQSFVSDLTGLSLRTKVYKGIAAVLSRGPKDHRLINDTITLLRAEDGNCAKGTGPLIVEWASQLELLQWCSPGGILDTSRWQKFCTDAEFDSATTELVIEPQATALLIDNCFSFVRDLFWIPYWQLIGERAALETRIATLFRWKEFQHYEFEEKIEQNTFAKSTFASFSRIVQLRHRAETHRHGAMLTLGLHLIRSRLGHWPESLDELGTELGWDDFESLRFDLRSGQEIIYKLAYGEPLLYSVGHDLKDDGGRHDARYGESEGGGDYRFWPYPDE